MNFIYLIFELIVLCNKHFLLILISLIFTWFPIEMKYFIHNIKILGERGKFSHILFT